MQRIPKEELDGLIKKYTSKLEKNISRDVEQPKRNSEFSREYETFKGEVLSKASTRYEKFAQFAGRIIKTKPNDKVIPKLEESLEITHLNLSLSDVSSFAIFYPLLAGGFFLILSIISFFNNGSLIHFLNNLEPIEVTVLSKTESKEPREEPSLMFLISSKFLKVLESKTILFSLLRTDIFFK